MLQLQEEKQRIREMLLWDEPDLLYFIEKVLKCCRFGFKFAELTLFMGRVRSHLSSICKMRFIL